ncbi:Oligosaccharide translocation protein rft1, partial [Linderina pennispora]
MANQVSEQAEEPVATGSAFAGAQYLMGLQLFTKLATFAMNIVIVRLAGIESFGVASVDFELLLATLLFLSREGMRNALLRITSDPPTRSTQRKPGAKDQLLINASLVPIAIGM